MRGLMMDYQLTLPPLLDRAEAQFDRAIRWLAIVGGLVLVGIVVLTVVDVLLRKFHEPIFGRQNISELALLVIVFFALAYCGRVKGHVAVDLIGNVAPRALLRVTEQRTLLEKTPVLKRSIEVRNPYVDPMSYLQVELLERYRDATGADEQDACLYAILLSLNGVAGGLRNTG